MKMINDIIPVGKLKFVDCVLVMPLWKKALYRLGLYRPKNLEVSYCFEYIPEEKENDCTTGRVASGSGNAAADGSADDGNTIPSVD